MEVSIESIKALREKTGAGIMDCKRALQQMNGKLDDAETILREKGVASAAARTGRAANQGLIDSYIHSGGRIGAMIELNCETDFVARTGDFGRLAHDLAMQVAAMSPRYVDRAEVPEGEEANPEEVCLMQQPFIRDPAKTVQDLVSEVAGKLGENVKIRRFIKFSLGE